MANQQEQQQHPLLFEKTNAAEVIQYYFYERMVLSYNRKFYF